MTALLSRRDDRCLSDLTMDRFLLGETSDSDEGRMLERHLGWCSACLARIHSLRTLYAHADMPEATHEPAPVPTPGALPAQRPDRVTGVVELILMRDGLLIGTEVFTPGVWVLGSGPRANLKLEAKGVAPEHAKLTFRNDSVVVERAQGSVLVNGFRVERSEVRPIDELIVGPFVVRARVITGRWSEAAPAQETPKLAPTRNMRALTPPAELDVEVEDETQVVTVPEQKALPPEAARTSAPEAQRSRAQHLEASAPSLSDARSRARHLEDGPLSTDARSRAPHLEDARPPSADARSRAPHLEDAPQLSADAPPHGRHPRADQAALRGALAQSPTVSPHTHAGATALSLRLDLYWGDALQASELVAGEVPPSAFPPFAPGREPSASPVAGGYRLCVPGAKLEVLEGTQWRSAGDELTLTPELRARVVSGALRLEARLQHAPALVAPKPKTDLLRGSFVPLLSFMMLALFVFSGMASTYGSDEDSFEPRTAPKLSVYMLPPPPKTKVEPIQPDKSTSPDPTPTPPTRRPPAAAPPSRRPPPHLAGLTGMNRVLDSVTKLTKLPLPTLAPGKGPRQGELFAGLGKLGKEGGKNGIGIGIGPDDATGIGATGAKFAGRMKTGRIGKSGVGGQLVGPLSRDKLAAPVGSIDRDAVLKVINSHLAEVSSCYERALLTNPSLSGKLTYEWGIGVDGKVTTIKLKSATIKDAGVAACISASMKQWTFPKPRGGTVTVSFPFMFQPTGF